MDETRRPYTRRAYCAYKYATLNNCSLFTALNTVYDEAANHPEIDWDELKYKEEWDQIYG